MAGYVGVCLIMLLLQKDLGAALLYAGTAIVMIYAGTSNKWLVGGALGTVAVGSVLAYKLFPMCGSAWRCGKTPGPFTKARATRWYRG